MERDQFAGKLNLLAFLKAIIEKYQDARNYVQTDLWERQSIEFNHLLKDLHD
jgi:hypothetical protein